MEGGETDLIFTEGSGLSLQPLLRYLLFLFFKLCNQMPKHHPTNYQNILASSTLCTLARGKLPPQKIVEIWRKKVSLQNLPRF